MIFVHDGRADGYFAKITNNAFRVATNTFSTT